MRRHVPGSSTLAICSVMWARSKSQSLSRSHSLVLTCGTVGKRHQAGGLTQPAHVRFTAANRTPTDKPGPPQVQTGSNAVVTVLMAHYCNELRHDMALARASASLLFEPSTARGRHPCWPGCILHAQDIDHRCGCMCLTRKR